MANDTFLKNLDRNTLMRWKFLPRIDTGRKSWVQEWIRGTLRDPAQHFEARTSRTCPCCGFQGLFVSAKRKMARESRCPWCRSRSRDRLLALVPDNKHLRLEDSRVMHFAPEWVIFNRLHHSPLYIGGDIKPRRNATRHLDITAIDAPDNSQDILIANHVLEHVPDETTALKECLRVLKPGGWAFLSVPVDMTQAVTWDPPADMPVEEVERICGWDHKRLYGRDLVDRISQAGFKAEIIAPTPQEAERHRILPEDVLFACQKP